MALLRAEARVVPIHVCRLARPQPRGEAMTRILAPRRTPAAAGGFWYHQGWLSGGRAAELGR
jgi:hypothetical protein